MKAFKYSEAHSLCGKDRMLLWPQDHVNGDDRR